MTTSITLQNNFDNFKADFKKDTGLEWASNLDKYLAYYQARQTDAMMQILLRIVQQNDMIYNKKGFNNP